MHALSWCSFGSRLSNGSGNRFIATVGSTAQCVRSGATVYTNTAYCYAAMPNYARKLVRGGGVESSGPVRQRLWPHFN